MGERQPARAEREITPKDVFARSNMPSRWERLTNVAPKTPQDRQYLAFVAARYRGDERLPQPDGLEPPDEFDTRRTAHIMCWGSVAVASAIAATGLATDVVALVVVGVVLAVAALAALIFVYVATQPVIGDFYALRSLCTQAESRLHADPLDSENTATLNNMINHDEGTLAYCAAKIASEIEQDSNWRSSRLDIVPIDLWEELAEVGASAKQIHLDRKAIKALEDGRLRDDPEVRAAIREDRKLTKDALNLLAARVSTFADYRDEVQRLSVYARRENSALGRAVRQVADEQARNRVL